MAAQNKSKLIVGLIFIVTAFICIIAVFYFMGQTHVKNQEKIAAMESKISELSTDPGTTASPAKDPKTSQLKLDDLLAAAQEVYSVEEKNRNEGLLWIDRQSQSYIVTLGALNGLQKGSELSLYDGSKKIDVVKVDLPFDIISFIKPPKMSLDLNGNYYRVVLENR